MPINKKYRVSKDKTRNIALEVSVSGSTIIVHKGKFRTRGEDYELLDDEIITVPAISGRDGHLRVYLVLDLDNANEVRVLADFIRDMNDERYNFNISTKFENLFMLIQGPMIEGQSTEDMDLTHYGCEDRRP